MIKDKNRHEKSLLVAGSFQRVIYLAKSEICFWGKQILADFLSSGNWQTLPPQKQIRGYKEQAKTYWIINRFYYKVCNGQAEGGR